VVVWVDDDPVAPVAATDDCGRRHRAGAPEVVVVWEGEELDDFCAVVDAYRAHVEVTSVGEGIREALRARRVDDLPDVAIIPQPSLVQRLATYGRLCPIEGDVLDRMPSAWLGLITGGEAGNAPQYPYGTFVKGVDKSLFWYRDGTIDDERPETWTWDELVDWVAGAVDDGSGVPPLTIPAANRWPLTDWFENQLAAQAPDLYRRLARGFEPDWGAPPDRDALVGVLDTMAEVWGMPGVFAPAPAGPGDTTWQELGNRLRDADARLAYGPSVVASSFDDLPGDAGMQPIGFPGDEAGQGPSIVGGDIAVVPKQGGSCDEVVIGRSLVDWLTDVEAMRTWIRRDPGYLTPNLRSPLTLSSGQAPDPADDVRRYLTSRLQHPPGGRLFFDLSDDRFALTNDGDATVTWAILADFFAEVTTGDIPRGCAIDRAITRLAEAYRGQAPSDPGCDT
jgi:alpha-glucoside transport system substrate-binding protein